MTPQDCTDEFAALNRTILEQRVELAEERLLRKLAENRIISLERALRTYEDRAANILETAFAEFRAALAEEEAQR